MRNRTPDGYHFSPDIGHELHPYRKELRRKPKLHDWLDADPVLQQFIQAYGEKIRQELDAIHTELVCGPLTPEQEQLIYHKTDELLKQIFSRIEDTCTKASPDLPSIAKFYYLLTQVVPSKYHGHIVVMSPVWISADARGAITLMFTGATSTERAAWNPLIHEVQIFFGHRQNKGGRPRIEAKERETEQARTAAKLCDLGWSAPEISSFLGWNVNNKEAERRVAEYIDRGIELLNAERTWPPRTPVPVARPARREALRRLKRRLSSP